MDKVIEKISDIESAATSIMDNAKERKKDFSKKMVRRTSAFDTDLEAKINSEVEKLCTDLEIEMSNQLEKQKNGSLRIQNALETHYEKNHNRYVEKLFQTMVKE